MEKMGSKPAKKGKSPNTVDSWLDNLGLYRKNVAYDETCLFRATSEQLFGCQIYHERVRKQCINYVRQHMSEFTQFFKDEAASKLHVDMLEKHMVICGNFELYLISKTYRRNITLFYTNLLDVEEIVTEFPDENPLYLCLTDEDHYDAVYTKEHIITAGFCQSIVYKVLYENVFNIQNVDEIVNSMLYEKSNIITTTDLAAIEMSEEPNTDPQENGLIVAPFPFKVAKALDPSIYRNIEYDSWGEMRREMRLGEWYYGDDKLILGTRCILSDRITNQTHDCYIQEILKDKNLCVVYLTKTAQKRLVEYSDLSPEDNAKPWPLPYRFSKSLVIGNNTTQLMPMDKVKSIRKKKNDKKRAKSLSESHNLVVNNVDAYIGVPLQMQTPSTSGPTKREMAISTASVKARETLDVVQALENVSDPSENHEATNTRYWEQSPQWPAQYVPQTPPDMFVWPTGTATSPPIINFNMKPMVASAPVTPNIIPYHDPNYPFYYNYHVYPYQQYNTGQWLPETPQTDFSSSYGTPTRYEDNGDMSQVAYDTTSATSTTMDAPNMYVNPSTIYPVHSPAPIEVYHQPMIPMHPGTPVIYTPTREIASGEAMVNPPTTPMTMYPPPTHIDIQYVPPPTAGYTCTPLTPPIGWYTPPINSQGFIFPVPNSTTH